MPDRSPLGSVDKALMALQQLGDAGSQGLSLSSLARQLGLHKASLHRTLAALRHRNFVEQDETTAAYRLGPNLLALADSYLRDGSLRGVLHEPLRTLSATVSELCHLGTLSGNEIVYVDKVEPQRAIRVWSETGRRSPALTTALGRAIICQSFADFESFAVSFPDEIPARTPLTRRSPTAIWEELAAARARGFAKEEQENEAGIACVAVAIRRGGAAIAAISVTAPHERMPFERMVSVVETIHRTIAPSLAPGLSLQKPIAAS